MLFQFVFVKGLILRTTDLNLITLTNFSEYEEERSMNGITGLHWQVPIFLFIIRLSSTRVE